MVRIGTLALLALLWAAVAVGVTLIARTTDVRWNAQIAYVLVAAAVLVAWRATDVILRRLGVDVPYRPA